MLNTIALLLLLATAPSASSTAADSSPTTSESLGKAKPAKLTEEEKRKFEQAFLSQPDLSEADRKQAKEYFAYLRERETWPKTVEQAVARVIAEIPADYKANLAKTPKSDLPQYLRTLGMSIRNEFGLWKGNPELTESACPKGCDPEEASMVIVEAVWQSLQPKQ